MTGSGADGKVVGIGGIFLRSDDPPKLSAWYREHLGIVATNAGEPGADGQWSWQQDAGETVTAFFPRDNAYFPVDRAVMINFRVAGLEALCARTTVLAARLSHRFRPHSGFLHMRALARITSSPTTKACASSSQR